MLHFTDSLRESNAPQQGAREHLLGCFAMSRLRHKQCKCRDVNGNDGRGVVAGEEVEGTQESTEHTHQGGEDKGARTHHEAEADDGSEGGRGEFALVVLNQQRGHCPPRGSSAEGVTERVDHMRPRGHVVCRLLYVFICCSVA